jgi:hypothetical protein
VEDYYEDSDNDEDKKKCLEQIHDEVLFYVEDEHPQSVYQKLWEFRYKDFGFDEVPCSEIYTHHYIWICYAIVWGILKYKERL